MNRYRVTVHVYVSLQNLNKVQWKDVKIVRSRVRCTFLNYNFHLRSFQL